MASEGGFVIIDSILRRGISHEYEGVLDLYLSEQGIVIVNELPLEDYVSKVVPSEMPVSYGLEAAKLQAVCARTYAYISSDQYHIVVRLRIFNRVFRADDLVVRTIASADTGTEGSDAGCACVSQDHFYRNFVYVYLQFSCQYTSGTGR